MPITRCSLTNGVHSADANGVWCHVTDVEPLEAELATLLQRAEAAERRVAELEWQNEILQKRVESLARKLPHKEMEYVPEGYKPIEAWIGQHDIVVLGDPGDSEDHHCDDMGCGAFGPHVIVRVPVHHTKAAIDAAGGNP